MVSFSNPGLKQQLNDFLAQQSDAFSWVETHGLMCAIAVGPTPTEGWQQAIFLEDGLSMPADIATVMVKFSERLASDLGASDGITLPCRLDPYEENENADLASWCTGFMAGVYSSEADWYDANEEDVANLLLPVVLISGLEEDEALDELWENTQLTRQMAVGLPDLLEELFLHFHAPDVPKEG